MAEGWTVPRLWNGERCFIIAGGTSARWSMREAQLAKPGPLPGRVLAIKDGFYLEPNADCMFYAGARYHKERPDLFERWEKYRLKPDAITVKRQVDGGVPRYVRQVRRSTKEKTAAGVCGLSLDPSKLGGWDSGGSAINLAFHLGVSEIILVGFDLAGQHWNPAHPYPRATPAEHERHRISIDAMAAPLQAAGVKCWNVSPVTTLQEFPRAKISDLV